MKKLEERSRSYEIGAGEAARGIGAAIAERLAHLIAFGRPPSPIPTWPSGSRPALPLPRSAGNRLRGRDTRRFVYRLIHSISVRSVRKPGVFDQSGVIKL